MSFLYPIAFWGLLALIIPTIILLMSKQKQRVVEFGSLAFLETSESKTARKVFPSQWLLYLLRVAIIVLVVLMLAEPAMLAKKEGKTILIEKEVYEDPDFKQVLETLGDDIEVIEPLSLSVLIRQLNERKDSVMVYTRSYAKDFKGITSDLGNHIEWKIVPNEQDFQMRDTVEIGGKKLQLLLTSGENGIKWNADQIKNTEQITADPISIQLLSSASRNTEKGQLKSIIKAYEGVIPVTFVFEGEGPAWTFVIDTIIDVPYHKVISWNDFEGKMKLNSSYSNVYEMKGELSTDHLSASSFPLELAHILLQEEFKMKDLDRRVHIPEQNPDSSQFLTANVHKEKVKYWWILIILLLIFERWRNRKLLGS